jgi:hypothetical protein
MLEYNDECNTEIGYLALETTSILDEYPSLIGEVLFDLF